MARTTAVGVLAFSLFAAGAIGPHPSAQSLSPEDRLDQYAQGRDARDLLRADSVQELLAIGRDLRRAAPAWIGVRGPNDEPRRRLAVAIFTLELVDANYQVAWQPGVGLELLEWACSLLRQGEPSPGEMVWLIASLGVYERLEGGLGNHLGHSERRFPGDARWTMARAIEEELTTWPERRDLQAFWLPQIPEGRLFAKFRDAAAVPAVRQEAELRWGYLELRLGHLKSAMTHFEAAGTPDDPVLRYWLHLFRGRLFEQLKRPSDAAAAYRQAFDEVPYAQTAALALGAALVADGRGTEAARLIDRMLSTRPAPSDPWTYYTFPDYRWFPGLVADLRKAIAP